MPSRLEHVVARNTAQLRRNRGWTQLDLAREMVDVGLGWTPGRAQQIESLAGTLTLPEVLGLCWVLRVPIADLLDGDDEVSVPGSARIFPLHQFRDALTGHGAIRQPDRAAQDVADLEEVRSKAVDLQISPDVFIALAQQRFGHSFRAERDNRAGDLSRLKTRSARVSRGHTSRAVLADLRQHLTSLGGPIPASLAVYHANADQLETQLDALERRTTDAESQPAPDRAEARDLVTESTQIRATLDKLHHARYTDDNLTTRTLQLQTRLDLAQTRITRVYGLHLQTHLADGTPL